MCRQMDTYTCLWLKKKCVTGLRGHYLLGGHEAKYKQCDPMSPRVPGACHCQGSCPGLLHAQPPPPLSLTHWVRVGLHSGSHSLSPHCFLSTFWAPGTALNTGEADDRIPSPWSQHRDTGRTLAGDQSRQKRGRTLRRPIPCDPI